MNWEQFLTEFVLRAISHPDITTGKINAPIQGILETTIYFARKSWDAIQAAELPESEKAKQSVIVANPPHLNPSNSTELKAMARTALDLFSDEAKWLAIDKNGKVWAYDLKPTIDTSRNAWDNSGRGGHGWEVGRVASPEDFTTELYRIDKLLNDGNE